MRVEVKRFGELEGKVLYQLLQLRSEVFVVEQQCLYLDMDGKDYKALHVLGWEGEELVACTRIFRPGDYYEAASIGRVAVSPGHRGKGLGIRIVDASIRAIREHFHTQGITLSAQSYLRKFYEDLGFRAVGQEYLEDGIPHIRMDMDGG